MTYNQKIFSKFHEKEMGMQVTMGGNTTYPQISTNKKPNKMPLGDVLVLHNAFFVLG